MRLHQLPNFSSLYVENASCVPDRKCNKKMLIIIYYLIQVRGGGGVLPDVFIGQPVFLLTCPAGTR